MRCISLKFKIRLFDETAVMRALTRISYEIVEKSADIENIVLIGIKTRGVPLAETLAKCIERNTGLAPLVSGLDITYYRDDVDAPQVQKPSLPFDINGKEVVIVDDVLFTGRTARAAIDALFDLGRPGKIRLAVLVDRGHRELPIRPDYVGKNVPSSMREIIKVNLEAVDGKTDICLFEKE